MAYMGDPTLQLTDIGLPRLVNANRFASERYVTLHKHHGSELVLVTEGRCVITVAGLELEGAKESLFILPADVPHDQRNEGFTRTTYVVFRAGAFDDRPRILEHDRAAAVFRWLEDLCDLYADAASAAVTGGLLLATIDWPNQLERRQCAADALHPCLAGAVNYLEAHVARQTDVDTVAAYAHASASHLTALFRKRFGCGPMQYQQRLRMERARRLLVDPYMTVAEVAAECGYEDVNYFCRLFKKRQGHPPGAWRRQAGQGFRS